MPSEITFPDPSGYTETPWTDPNGKQWIADSKGRWSAYKADTGGSGAWDDITGKPVAITSLTGTNTGDETLATIKTKLGVSTLSGSNTGDQDISGLLTISTAASTYQTQSGMSSYLTTATAASTYSPISTTVTLAGTQTLTNKSISAGQITGLGALATSTDAANLTGNIARARIDNALSANAAPIVATTVTASGAVSCGSEGTSNTLTVGNQTANSSSAKIRINGKSGGGTALHGEWVMRSNAYFALDTYGATDAIRVDASTGRVAFTRGIEGNTLHNGFMTIGTTTVTTEDDGLLVVNKGYATATGNHHAIRVKSTDSVLAAGAGVNFFDAQAIVSSNNNIDHVAEFQARSNKSGSGTMSDWFGYWTSPVFSAGTTTRAAHVHIEDATGAGTLTTQYGVRIKPLTKGATNYAIVTEGTAPCVFGGNLTASGTVTAAQYLYTTALFVTESTTARTLTSADHGKTIVCTNSSAVAITLNTGLPTCFFVTIIQKGAGQVTVSGSATLEVFAGFAAKTAGQHAQMSVSNYGTSNVYHVAGQLGT